MSATGYPHLVDSHAELLAGTPLTAVDAELAAAAAEAAGDRPPGSAALAVADFVRASVRYVPGSTGVHTGAQEAWSLREGLTTVAD